MMRKQTETLCFDCCWVQFSALWKIDFMRCTKNFYNYIVQTPSTGKVEKLSSLDWNFSCFFHKIASFQKQKALPFPFFIVTKALFVMLHAFSAVLNCRNFPPQANSSLHHYFCITFFVHHQTSRLRLPKKLQWPLWANSILMRVEKSVKISIDSLRFQWVHCNRLWCLVHEMNWKLF